MLFQKVLVLGYILRRGIQLYLQGKHMEKVAIAGD